MTFMRSALLASAITIALPGLAAAQQAQVNFTLNGNQQSLRDAGKHDVYDFTVSDQRAVGRYSLTCSAGSSSWGGLVRKDESCKVSGTGDIINPTTKQAVPITTVTGGYVISASEDGYTDLGTIAVNYNAVGNSPAQTGKFNGSMKMLPENPASSARELAAMMLKRAEEAAGGQSGVDIDPTVDVVELTPFTVPKSGFPKEVGCSLKGNMVFVYELDLWQMDIVGQCGDATYPLQGNFAWVDLESGDAEYRLNLIVPGKGGDPFAEPDPFATVDGIQGTVTMKLGGLVEVKIDEQTTDEVPSQIGAAATFTGAGVPLELVRAFATMVGINARTFFGA